MSFISPYEPLFNLLDRFQPAQPTKTEGEVVYNVRFHTGYRMCNFSCPYCVAGHGEASESPEGDLEIADPTWDGDRFDRIARNLAQVPLPLNIRLQVPGEIFTNKRLLAGAKMLARSENVRSLNLLTNLSFKKHQYERILGDVDPKKWAFVASHHPTDIRDVDAWIESARFMNERFDFAVILVAWPPLLDQLVANKKRLEAEGLHVFVQAYMGEHGGKSYPEAYTEQERELLRSVFYSRHDYEFMVNLKRPDLCNAGFRSFYVDETGRVRPCGKRWLTVLGDLSKSPEIRLGPAPRRCPFRSCQCDTDNVNTLVFHQHYRKTGINQHRYEYRFTEEAKTDPSRDEWKIPY